LTIVFGITAEAVTEPQEYSTVSLFVMPFLAKHTLCLDEARIGANAKSKTLAQLVVASNTNQVHIENPSLALIAPKLRVLIRKYCPPPEESLVDESTAHREPCRGPLEV
jgi:hypothetical protein